MRAILITGANRGLGLAFSRHYVQMGDQVIATCRDPGAAGDLAALATASNGRLTVHQLDVTSEEQAHVLVKELAGRPIDIFVCNAGINSPRVSIDGVTEDDFLKVMKANVMGPMRLTALLLDQIAVSDRRLIAYVSSRMGSIGENARGGSYVYRASKAALNAVVKSLSIDLAPRGITVVLLHPGHAQTSMGGPNADVSVADSVRGMTQAYESCTPQQSGSFLNYTGEPIAW